MLLVHVHEQHGEFIASGRVDPLRDAVDTLSVTVSLMTYAAHSMERDCSDSAYSLHAFSAIPARVHPRVVCEGSYGVRPRVPRSTSRTQEASTRTRRNIAKASGRNTRKGIPSELSRCVEAFHIENLYPQLERGFSVRAATRNEIPVCWACRDGVDIRIGKSMSRASARCLQMSLLNGLHLTLAMAQWRMHSSRRFQQQNCHWDFRAEPRLIASEALQCGGTLLVGPRRLAFELFSDPPS